MIAKNITDLVGNTPMIEITHLDIPDDVRILAKCEFLNPTGSAKDRIAVYMIQQALKRGDITPDTVLVEPTSGNTGIGLAAVCASLGMDLVLTMPESMSLERRKLLEYLGAKIILTPASEGMSGSVKKAQEIVASDHKYFMLDQFGNPDNPDAHYHTTAREIVKDLGKVPDILVAGAGTGGTLSGTGKYLKEIKRDLLIVAVEPASSAVISGEEAGTHSIQGIGAGFVPEIMDLSLLNDTVKIDDDTAVGYASEAAMKAGLLVGISSGANLAAVHILAQKNENRGKTIVTMLPDGAERYLSTSLF